MEASEALSLAKQDAEAQLRRARADVARLEEALVAIVDAEAKIEAIGSGRPAGGGQADGAGQSSPVPAPSRPPSPPSRDRPASSADKQRQVDEVVEAIRAFGQPVAKSEVFRTCELSDYQCRQAIGEAVRCGRIEAVGKGAGTRYVAVETSTPATPPARRRQPGPVVPQNNGNGRIHKSQEPTLEGRVLGALQLMTDPSASQIASRLSVTLDVLTPALSALIRDGDIRTRKVEDRVGYRLAV